MFQEIIKLCKNYIDKIQKKLHEAFLLFPKTHVFILPELSHSNVKQIF